MPRAAPAPQKDLAPDVSRAEAEKPCPRAEVLYSQISGEAGGAHVQAAVRTTRRGLADMLKPAHGILGPGATASFFFFLKLPCIERVRTAACVTSTPGSEVPDEGTEVH